MHRAKESSIIQDITDIFQLILILLDIVRESIHILILNGGKNHE
jgi:hypothetical protein